MGGAERGECMPTCTLSWGQFILQGLVSVLGVLEHQRTKRLPLYPQIKTARQAKISEQHTVCLI